MTDENTGEWIECVVDSDYEIFNEYPYPIRRKGSDKVIKEHIGSGGYAKCHLNRKQYMKHRIIAQQFIPNPDNKPYIDHIDRNRTNNQLNNLRWVNGSTNQKNRKATSNGALNEFFVEIPTENEENIIEVQDYSGHKFEGLYYCENNFYVNSGNGNYRRLHVLMLKDTWAYVNAYDEDLIPVQIFMLKFKKQYRIED